MAQHDSESSDPEEDGYTETKVLLGYASRDVCDDIASHLGGRPHWINPACPPSANLAKCKVCNNLMVLLLQLNGDLPDKFPGHVRRIYVWVCRRRTCRRKDGSIRALRGVQVLDSSVKECELSKCRDELNSTKKNPDTNLGEVLFASRPISNTNLIPVKTTNPFATHASKLYNNPCSVTKINFQLNHSPEINHPLQDSVPNLSKMFSGLFSSKDCIPKIGPLPLSKPWPQESEFPPAYPLIYLVDTEYEILENKTRTPHPAQTIEVDDGLSKDKFKEDKVVYESSIDQTFQKFADRLGQNPEQVIRYEFNGQPLLYSKNDSVGKLLSDIGKENLHINLGHEGYGNNRIPRCENCHAGRVFELQLTPQAITELEKGEKNTEEGMDWGTVIIGVCKQDCQKQVIDPGGVGYVEEWVGIQWEELVYRK